MNKNKIEDTINKIEKDNNILTKYENITILHKIINDEEEKIDKLYDKIERITETKYDDMDLDKIISKFNKSDNLEKKIKYYHAISNKIDKIVNTINN
jgi:hypothetical protein